MLAAVLMIHHFSKKENGFAIGTSTSSYTWKYGPTAVMTIVIALWRQTDHSFKIEAPWIEMSKRSSRSSANQSVLLDYTSPLLPAAFVLSIKNGHWRVSTSITVFALLKLAVLFSTALLALQTTTLAKQDVPISLDTGGNDTLAWRTEAANSPYYINEYYGIVGKGLQYPPRTLGDSAYQEISSQNTFPPGARVTTDVLAFFPHLQCEVAAIKHNFTTDTSGDHYITFNFQSDSCYGRGPMFDTCDPSKKICTPREYHGGVFYYNCPEFGAAGANTNTWLIALIALHTHQESSPGNSSEIIEYTQSIPWGSGVLCQSKYSIENAILSVDTGRPEALGGTSLSSPTTNTGNMIPGYSYDNLSTEVSSVFVAGGGDLETKGGVPPSTETVSYSDVDAWFHLGLLRAHSTDLTLFQNESFLIETSVSVFKGLASAWVGSWLSFPQHLSTSGNYSFDVQRLHTQPSSVWGMSVVLTMGIVLLLFLLAIPNPENCPRHPDTMSSQAFQAYGSPDLLDLLSDSGHNSNEEIKHRVSSSTFATIPEPPLLWRIEAKGYRSPRAPPLPERKPPQPPVRPQIKHWTPIAAGRAFGSLACSFPVLIIVVLEILQRVSDKHQGFCDTLLPFPVAQAFISFFPAAVMLGTAAIYSSIEWAVRIYAPFHSLKKGRASIRHINYSSLGELPLVAIVRSMRRNQVAVSMIIASATFGSILTIVVSGLYSIHNAPKAYTTSIRTLNQFNTTWNGTQDYGGGNVFSLIQNHNASFPAGTYNEVVFPSFTLNDSDHNVRQILKFDGSTHVDISMPVTRASLNCTVVPKKSMKYKLNPSVYEEGDGYASYMSPTANITVVMDLPQECRYSSGIWHNASQVRLESSIYMPTAVNEPIAGAQIMQVGSPGSPAPVGTRVTYENYPYFPAHCPSIAFVAGKFRNDTSTDGKTVLLCSQYQEEVPGVLSFAVPGLALDATIPPRLDESKVRTVSGAQYDFANLLSNRLEYANVTTNQPVDDFYNAVLYYLGVPIQDLVRHGNEEALLNITQHLYRQYMAQIMNDAMRLSSANLDTKKHNPHVTPIGTTLNATIYDSNRLRVTQNNISKIILQAVLAAMVLCFVAAYLLIDMRRTLPHNPCTIAGSMSLLVGSDLMTEVGRVLDDGEDEKALGRRLGDMRLRLGWWPEPFSGNDARAEQLLQGKSARFKIDLVK